MWALGFRLKARPRWARQSAVKLLGTITIQKYIIGSVDRGGNGEGGQLACVALLAPLAPLL